MRHLCMRSACSGRAVVLVEMDVREVSFTVRDLDEVAGPGQVVLCETHVGRLRAPKGWVLVDARTVGRLLPFPDSDERSRRFQDRHLARPGETVRSIADARHPLDVDRSTSSGQAVTDETPLLSRAFAGPDSLRSTVDVDSAGIELLEPFPDEQWDQRDHRDKESSAGSDDGQMEFDSFDFEPSA